MAKKKTAGNEPAADKTEKKAATAKIIKTTGNRQVRGKKGKPTDFIDVPFTVVTEGDGQDDDGAAIRGALIREARKDGLSITDSIKYASEKLAEMSRGATAGDGRGDHKKPPAEQSNEEWRVTKEGLEKEIEARKKNSDFLKKVYKSLEGLTASQYKDARVNIAGKFKITVEYLDTLYNGNKAESKGSKGRRTSQKDRIVKMVLNSGAELWHFQDEPYSTFKTADHTETSRIRDRRFKRHISRLFYQATRQAPSSQAMQDALCVIEGRALFDGPEYQVNLRIAGDGVNRIIVDLSDPEWNGIEITKAGWQIVPLAGLEERFIRPPGMAPLPYPEKGSSFNALRSLINIEDDFDFSLLKAFVIGCFRPVPPGRPISRPVLTIGGEQGAAKSSLCNLVKKIVDPSLPLSRSAPREERDLAIAARNSWVIAYDNLSYIPDWLSDALSRLSTGAGFATRTLYENDSESLFSAIRSIVMNGIEEVASRPDLLDRAIPLTAPVIPHEKRLVEDDYWRSVEDALPGIMGAVFDALSATLRSYPIKIACLPRMADFATWSVSTEVGMGWKPLFLQAYAKNRAQANSMAIEGNHIAEELLKEVLPSSWTGTAAELLEELNIHVSDTVQKLKEWPKSARGISGQLRRIAPNLRKVGVNAIFSRGKNRLIEIVRDSTDVTDGTDVKGDGCDGTDGQIHTLSTRTDEQGVLKL